MNLSIIGLSHDLRRLIVLPGLSKSTSLANIKHDLRIEIEANEVGLYLDYCRRPKIDVPNIWDACESQTKEE